MGFHVDSETGRLRRVILHRPDLELKRLTPSNKDALLFEEDGYEALTDVEDLAERLVEAERWTPERARALVDDVAACGPLTGARE